MYTDSYLSRVNHEAMKMVEAIVSSNFKHSPTWLSALQAVTELVLAGLQP